MLRDEGRYKVFAATLNKEGVLLQEFQDAYPLELPEYRLSSFFDRNFIRQVRGFAGYLKDNRIDLIHSHDFYTNVFGMAAATLARTPARVTSKRESGGLRSSSQDLVEKAALGLSDAILVNSRAVMDHLASRGIASRKMHLIYNGTDIDSFENPRAEFKLAPSLPNGRLITLVANLRHSVKNVPMFLRVSKRVATVHPDAHFVIAGEGELEPELKNLAAELQVADRVHFIGRCDNVPALLNASYACVLTSSAEGFSNSLIEYMAAGRPVVATDVGGASEAVQESLTGFIVGSDDDAAMGKRLIALLNDEKIAKRMGTAGKAIARERFSLGSQLSGVLTLYDRLIAN